MVQSFKLPRQPDIVAKIIGYLMGHTGYLTDYTQGSIIRSLAESIASELYSYNVAYAEGSSEAILESIKQSFNMPLQPSSNAYGTFTFYRKMLSSPIALNSDTPEFNAGLVYLSNSSGVLSSGKSIYYGASGIVNDAITNTDTIKESESTASIKVNTSGNTARLQWESADGYTGYAIYRASVNPSTLSTSIVGHADFTASGAGSAITSIATSTTAEKSFGEYFFSVVGYDDATTNQATQVTDVSEGLMSTGSLPYAFKSGINSSLKLIDSYPRLRFPAIGSAKAYKILRSKVGRPFNIYGSLASNYATISLSNSASYYYSIRAKINTTYSAPTEPSAGLVVTDSTTVAYNKAPQLRWASITGATGYTIYRGASITLGAVSKTVDVDIVPETAPQLGSSANVSSGGALEVGQTYYYAVTSVSSSGDHLHAESKESSTLTVPIPSDLTKTVPVTITKTTSASRYNIYRWNKRTTYNYVSYQTSHLDAQRSTFNIQLPTAVGTGAISGGSFVIGRQITITPQSLPSGSENSYKLGEYYYIEQTLTPVVNSSAIVQVTGLNEQDRPTELVVKSAGTGYAANITSNGSQIADVNAFYLSSIGSYIASGSLVSANSSFYNLYVPDVRLFPSTSINGLLKSSPGTSLGASPRLIRTRTRATSTEVLSTAQDDPAFLAGSSEIGSGLTLDISQVDTAGTILQCTIGSSIGTAYRIGGIVSPSVSGNTSADVRIVSVNESGGVTGIVIVNGGTLYSSVDDLLTANNAGMLIYQAINDNVAPDGLTICDVYPIAFEIVPKDNNLKHLRRSEASVTGTVHAASFTGYISAGSGSTVAGKYLVVTAVSDNAVAMKIVVGHSITGPVGSGLPTGGVRIKTVPGAGTVTGVYELDLDTSTYLVGSAVAPVSMITNTVFTVTAADSNTARLLSAGHLLINSSTLSGTKISALGTASTTGTGGVGTYVVTPSQNIVSSLFSSYNPVTLHAIDNIAQSSGQSFTVNDTNQQNWFSVDTSDPYILCGQPTMTFRDTGSIGVDAGIWPTTQYPMHDCVTSPALLSSSEYVQYDFKHTILESSVYPYVNKLETVDKISLSTYTYNNLSYYQYTDTGFNKTQQQGFVALATWPRLNTASAIAGNIYIPSGTQVSVPGTGKIYRTVANAIMDASANNIAVRIESLYAGSFANTPKYTITKLVSSIYGIGAGRNDYNVTTGTDSETNEEWKRRFSRTLKLLGRSTRESLEEGAKTAFLQDSGGYIVESITKSLASEGINSLVSLYVHNGTSSACSAQLLSRCDQIISGYIDTSNGTVVSGYKAAGIPVSVRAAQFDSYSTDFQLTVDSGSTIRALSATVQFNVDTYVSDLDISDGFSLPTVSASYSQPGTNGTNQYKVVLIDTMGNRSFPSETLTTGAVPVQLTWTKPDETTGPVINAAEILKWSESTSSWRLLGTYYYTGPDSTQSIWYYRKRTNTSSTWSITGNLTTEGAIVQSGLALTAPGLNYRQNDQIDLIQANGLLGRVLINSVDGSGVISTWSLIRSGTGYQVGSVVSSLVTSYETTISNDYKLFGFVGTNPYYWDVDPDLQQASDYNSQTGITTLRNGVVPTDSSYFFVNPKRKVFQKSGLLQKIMRIPGVSACKITVTDSLGNDQEIIIPEKGKVVRIDAVSIR